MRGLTGHPGPVVRLRSRVALFGLLVMGLGVARAESAPPTGELHVGVPRVATSLDPAAATVVAELLAARLVYQGLVAFGERGDIEPGLAATWAVSRDGLVWTFRLRPDLVLHDGTPLGVDEVVAALAGRLSADEAPEGAPSWIRPLRGAARILREVRRGEGGTVQVVLGQPYAPILALLAHPGLGVAVPQGDGRWSGSGPYRVVELGPGRLVLEAAASWRGEPPRSARLVLHEVADDAAALAGLAPGGPLHAALLAAPPAWAALGLQVVSAPSWRIGLLALRTERGLTSRKILRQAVALALDPGLLRPALGRWASLHGAWLPPGAWAARDAGVPFDPVRARRLVGQVAPLDPTLTLLASDQASGPEAAAIAEAIRISLGPAGFRTQVRLDAPEAASAAARQGAADLTLHEVTLDVNDPDFFLRPLLAADGATAGSATNVAFLRSPLVDTMLLRASQLGFRPERLRLYQRLQALLADEVPYVPLYSRLQWLVARPEVRDARLEPSGLHRLERAWVETPPPPPAPPPPAPPAAAPAPATPPAAPGTPPLRP